MTPTDKTTDQDKNKAKPKGAQMGKKQAQRADALRANLMKRKQQARARTSPENTPKEKN